MRKLVFIAACFFAHFMQAQENRFVDWPFLRDICTIDTNCVKFKAAGIVSFCDSVFKGNDLLSIQKRNYDSQGRLHSIYDKQSDSLKASFVVYDCDKDGRVTKASLSGISGKDTTLQYYWEILKYDLQYRPSLQHYHVNKNSGATSTANQFTDDQLVLRYAKTDASTHWNPDYGTDSYIRSSYSKPLYGWVEDRVQLNGKDTLYESIRFFDKKYSFLRVETTIYTNDSIRTKTVIDSLYNISETITWKRGKMTEHHLYKNEYAAGELKKVSILDVLGKTPQRQFVVEYLPGETVITPENKTPVHESSDDDNTPPPPAPPPPPVSVYTYTTKKAEAGLNRYDFFNFKVSTQPLLSKWTDSKGLLVKYSRQNLLTKRTYVFR